METVTQSHRAIRAAAEGRPLAVMADDILAQALEKRRQAQALEKNPALAATLATVPPHQSPLETGDGWLAP